MRRQVVFALIACAVITNQACDAQPAPPVARTYQTGMLTIGGEAFAPGEVADARAMPDINKRVGIMLSLTPGGARRLETVSGSLIGKPMVVALDGKGLSAELIRKPIKEGVIELPGRWTLDEAEALARRISGKDPLPDDLGM